MKRWIFILKNSNLHKFTYFKFSNYTSYGVMDI